MAVSKVAVEDIGSSSNTYLLVKCEILIQQTILVTLGELDVFLEVTRGVGVNVMSLYITHIVHDIVIVTGLPA